MGVYDEPASRAVARIRRKEVGISVVGLGTVGLTVALHLAHVGFQVRGLDISRDRVARIREGSVRFEFPSMLKEARKTGRLNPTVDPSEALEKGEVIFVCVPTSLGPDNAMNTSDLDHACESIAKNMTKGALVLVESTVTIGTCRKIAETLGRISTLKVAVDFGLAHCPERYNPTLPSESLPSVYYGGGTPRAEQDYRMISRVIGGIDAKSTKLGGVVYSQFTRGTITLLSSIEAAEATKLLENTFRDVNIALVNEIAQLCESVGVDIYEVIEAAKTKHFAFLPHYPGPGVGGECIPVVPWFLIKQAEDHGLSAKLMSAAREVNDSMPAHLFSILAESLKSAGREAAGARVTVLGLAYKKNINDVRFSPALSLLKLLRSQGCEAVACDPVIEPLKQVGFLVPLKDCFKGSDAVVLVTDHDAFSKIDFRKVRREMRTPIIVDGRHFFDGTQMRSLGFFYSCVGVPHP